jgi:Na+-transporting NADH:ubiquinone oxidoreductase subunit A
MGVHKIKKGLDLPIAGKPTQQIFDGPTVSRVAIMADDFPGMRPGFEVEVGDPVRRGQVLFRDRKRGEVAHTAPAAGTVVAINRGARRTLLSVVIELTESERERRPGDDDFHTFESYTGTDPDTLDGDGVRALLLESGLWTALRERPFSKVPTPDAEPPHSIFVTAADTNPLAADPEVALGGQRDDFDLGLRLLSKLTEGNTYLCVSKGSGVTQGLRAQVQVEEFAGPHPAGTAGIHIHRLAPVSRARTVWWIGYQDVASVGRLFSTGRLDLDRVVALGGPPLAKPRLVRTRAGASTHDLLADEEAGLGDVRYISGSVLSGKKAMGEVFGFIGRYDNQVSVVEEAREREFLGWLSPGAKKYSMLPIYVSGILRPKEIDFNTSTNGSERAIVPIGMYESVMPFDMVTTYLLRALAVGDVETAEELGCLELAEEDVALCTFVDAGKNDFGPILRKNLEIIEREG